jgi:hypothetical protein
MNTWPKDTVVVEIFPIPVIAGGKFELNLALFTDIQRIIGSGLAFCPFGRRLASRTAAIIATILMK